MLAVNVSSQAMYKAALTVPLRGIGNVLYDRNRDDLVQPVSANTEHGEKGNAPYMTTRLAWVECC